MARFVAQFVSGITRRDVLGWPIVAPNIVLLGGIGLRQMPYILEWTSKHYVNTYVVPGPEEMIPEKGVICPRMKITTEPLRKIAAHYDNVHVLCRDTCDVVPGVRIAGLTWWPHVPLIHEREYLRYIDDLEIGGMSHISHSVDMQNRLHSGDEHWLTGQIILAQSQNVKLMIASRYAPSYHAIPEAIMHTYPARKHFVACPPGNLLRMGDADCVRTWVYGAGTKAVSSVIENTLTMNNPIGTPGGVPELTVRLGVGLPAFSQAKQPGLDN